MVDQNKILGHNKIMQEKRKTQRFRTESQARISGIAESDGLLKDISITGCCIECDALPEVAVGTHYQLDIIPETAANIGIFRLEVESRWIRGEEHVQAGFFIVASPKGKQFQNYVDFLTYRGAHP